ncbi:MAG: tetratricopeptide repeat protein, partial [Planctomycetota bacterium]
MLVEGSLGEPERTRAYEHLQICPKCFEDFKDTAIGLGIWTMERDYFGEHPKLVSAGLKIAGDGAAKRHRASGDFTPNINKLRWIAIAACTALIILMAVWIPGRMNRQGMIPAEEMEAIEAILAVAEMASSSAEIVFPGTEASFDPNLPPYRSAIEYNYHLLSSALIILEERNKKNPGRRDDLFWLATGFLSTSQPDDAKRYINIAREKYPNDPEIAVLNALALHLEGKSEEAERLLRDVHSNNPEQAVAHFNLCVILLELEKTEEAKVL